MRSAARAAGLLSQVRVQAGCRSALLLATSNFIPTVDVRTTLGWDEGHLGLAHLGRQVVSPCPPASKLRSQLQPRPVRLFGDEPPPPSTHRPHRLTAF
jgi:hypothetical protein